MAEERARLQSMDLEEGLMRVLRTAIPVCAATQESWLNGGEPLLR
jgi:hypothetical protein